MRTQLSMTHFIKVGAILVFFLSLLVAQGIRVQAVTPTITLENKESMKIMEYNGNSDIALSGMITDSTNHSVTIAATLNGITKTALISNTAIGKPWSLKWNTISDSIPSGVFKNIAITATDNTGNVSTVTYAGFIEVIKVNPDTFPGETVKQKSYVASAWGNFAGYTPVRIPTGYLPFGNDDVSTLYIIGSSSGQLKSKTKTGNDWATVLGYTPVSMPTGYVPYDIDGKFYQIVNPKTGKVLSKQANDTQWTDFVTFYKEVSFPAGFIPFGIYKDRYFIVNPTTGVIQYKDNNGANWLINETLYKKTIFPAGFSPIGVDGSTFTIVSANENLNNEGTTNIGRYLSYNLVDSSGNSVTTMSKTETSKVVFLKGNYEIDGLLGTETTVKYSVHSKDGLVPIYTGTIKNPFSVDDSNKTGSFNKSVTFKTTGTCSADEICVPNSSSSFTVRVYVEHGAVGNEQVFTQLNKIISVEGSVLENYKDVEKETSLAIEKGDFHMEIMDLNNNKLLVGNEHFNQTALKTTLQRFGINGHIVLDEAAGKKIDIRYDVIDYDSYLNKSTYEGLIQTYTQTLETKSNLIPFERAFGLKVTTGEAPGAANYNIIPDEKRDYVIRVTVHVDGQVKYLQDLPIHVANSVSTPTGDVGKNLHEKVPTLPAGEKIGYSLTSGTKIMTSMSLTDLRTKRIPINMLGIFKDAGIPVDENVTIRYKITSIDDAYFQVKEQLIEEYAQTNYTNANNLPFNRTLHFKSEATPEAVNENSPTIYLKDYPAKYTFLVEAVYGENEAVSVQKTVEFEVTGTREDYFHNDGITPPFPDKTNLEFKLSKDLKGTFSEIANTETNQTVVQPIMVSDIRNTPLKLHIDGSFTNKIDSQYDNIIIQYDVTALENYSDISNVNKVLSTFTESVDTEGRTTEFNRDFWISTESRTNKNADNKEGTIYLEDYTQYYTVRVTAKNLTKNTTVVLRDIKVLVKSSEESHQGTEGPSFTLTNGLSSYFFDKDGNRVETLEINARDLNNAKDGIDIDVQGFLKTGWTSNQNVQLTYELKALNSYKDYINFSSGLEETLELDFNDKINGTSPTAYVSRTVVDPMEKWLDGKSTQEGFFKNYVITSDTMNRHEAFSRKFNLRTKLEKNVEALKTNESVLFLDNVARSYELYVYATNKSTNEVITKVINLKITTVKPDEVVVNTKPKFEKPVSVSRPSTGTGWFIDEEMPIRWTPAQDAEQELMYYKTYYYYTTTDATGLVNNEIRNWVQRVEDMPVSGGALAYDWIVDTPAKLEPVNVRVIACDINHVCSEPTRSNPFKINEFGLQDGGGNDGGGGGLTANIAIYPKPDGKWTANDLDLSVMYDGDINLIEGASKRYAITNSAQFPVSLPNSLNSSGVITVSNNGNNYVHVQYELSNGQTISASAGPYKIDKNEIEGFEIRLENNVGEVVTDWTNEPLNLIITNPTSVSPSGTNRQYMIEGYHKEWQQYKPGVKISIDGNYRVFGRVINTAGTFAEQKFATAKIDKIKPTFDELKLTKLPTGKYDVSALTYDGDSGISRVVLSTGKELAMNGSPIAWIASNLDAEPTSIRIIDKAGNASLNEMFLDLPEVKFKDGYTNTADIWRKDVIASIEASGSLSYKLSNKSYGCSNSPCEITVSKNTNFTAIHKLGTQTSSVITSFENIDKSPIRLILNAERDKTVAEKITFAWNHSITGGKLVCDYPGGTIEHNVNGLGVIINGVSNATYKCLLNGTVLGEQVKSNALTIYPDYGKEIVDSGTESENIKKQLLGDKTNIYIEESRLGTTYMLGTRKNNSKDNIVPLPINMFQ